MTKTITLIFLMFLTLNSCEPIDPNKQIDEGIVENKIYKSKELGWSMEIPKNWEVTSRQQNDASTARGKEIIENVLEEEVDMSKMKQLIGFRKNIFNIFQSTSEPFKLEYEGEYEDNNTELKKLIYYTYESKGMKVDSSITTTAVIDGIEFLTYEFTIYSPEGKIILNQKLYAKLINGFDFGVNINSNNEIDKKEMLDAWLNSKFEK